MPATLIVLCGQPDWAASLPTDPSYTLSPYTQAGPGYLTRLAEDHAALILVDGDGPDWRFWTTAPKTSPATRRIPIVLVSADAARRAESLGQGADVVVAPAEIAKQLPALVKDYARVIDPATAEQLDCGCAEPLPPLAQEGVAKFNAGEYYPQHDLFEEQWMATPGPVRDLYRAILQVGVAYYQIERGNHRGALKMLLRSVQWLSILPDTCQGVDVQQLREDSYRVRAALEALPPAEIGSFDRSLLKPVKWVEQTAQG
jgi:predicted metal-dependent hydrolase